MSDISLRAMTEGDLAGADELRRLVGWNQTPEHWRRLLRLEPQGCFVALRDKAVIGTVTTTSYGQALAWIGMMLVRPEMRRQGIGMRLMRQALAYLQGRGIPCIKLDATPAGFPLYQQLGFLSEWMLTRWQKPEGVVGCGQGAFKEIDLSPARELIETDWPAVDKIDTAAFGVARTELIRSLAQERRKALVWPAHGPVTGWGLLRPGPNADYIGPLVCLDEEGSLSLLTELLREAGSRSIFWDVPDDNAPARTAAKHLGFAPVRPLTRMRLGLNSVRSDPRAQFAIADPAVG